MIKRIIPLIPILLLIAETAAGQQGEIHRKAVECFKAIVTHDHEKLADLTYPGLVRHAGGRKALVELLRSETEQMEKAGITFETFTVHTTPRIEKTERRIFGVMEYSIEMKMPEGSFIQRSATIAVSEDKGNSWHLIDAGGMNEQKLRMLFPDEQGLYQRLALPEKKKPVRKQND